MQEGCLWLGKQGLLWGEVLLAFAAVWVENSQPMLQSISICTSAPFSYSLGPALPRSHMTSSKGDKTEQLQSRPLHSASRYILTSPLWQPHAVLLLSQDLTYWKLINSEVGSHCVIGRRPLVSLDRELVTLPNAESAFSLILFILCTWKQCPWYITHMFAGAALIPNNGGTRIMLVFIRGWKSKVGVGQHSEVLLVVFIRWVALDS